MPTSPTQTASFSLATRPLSIDAKVEVTPGGLLAIAALVTGILLATSVLVWTAKR